MRPLRLGLMCLAIAGVLVTGCGSKPDMPPMASVSGVVTLDGESLPRASLQFVPDVSKNTRGPTGTAFSDDKGRYQVSTANVQGALVGFHRISVVARKAPKNEMDTLPPSLIPERYGNPNTSQLTAEVKGGQKNEVNLAIQSR